VLKPPTVLQPEVEIQRPIGLVSYSAVVFLVSTALPQRSNIKFCQLSRSITDRPSTAVDLAIDGRIHMLTTNPQPELFSGRYINPGLVSVSSLTWPGSICDQEGGWPGTSCFHCTPVAVNPSNTLRGVYTAQFVAAGARVRAAPAQQLPSKHLPTPLHCPRSISPQTPHV
jgi:hypothetical protein